MAEAVRTSADGSGTNTTVRFAAVKYCAGWSPLKIGTPPVSASPPAYWASTTSGSSASATATVNSNAVDSPGPSAGKLNGSTADEKPNHVEPAKSGFVPGTLLEPEPAASAAVVAVFGTNENAESGVWLPSA